MNTTHKENENTMTAISTDVDALFNGSANPTFTKDMTPGEIREGIVLAAPTAVQATKFQSQELDFWPNGDPKMQLRIEMATEYQLDADDQGDRTLYVKTWGGPSRAFTEAVLATGFAKVSEVVVPGTVIRVTFKGKQQVRSKNGSTFEENAYEYAITPGSAAQGPATPAPAATATAAPAPPAPAPAPSAAPAAPAAPAPTNPAEMIAAGWTDQQITQAVPGLTADVITWLRTQA